MSSVTTRLGLYKPAGGENVNVTTDLNNNLDALDLAAGYQIVTAATRPAAPYAGKGILESDTSYRSYFSNGTSPASASWVEIPNSSGTYGGNIRLASGSDLLFGGVSHGRGTLAHAVQPSAVTGVTTTETVINSTPSITFVNGRAYRITIVCFALSSVAADLARFGIRKGTTIGGTLYHDWFDSIYLARASQNMPWMAQKIAVRTAGTNLSTEISLTGYRAAGTGTLQFNLSASNQSYIHVEDIGAATSFTSVYALT